MVINIRKNDNSKLCSADISLKNGLLERHLWVPNTVLQHLKMKKPLLKELFRQRDSSISMNGTLLGRAMTVGAAAILASQQMVLHKDFALSNGYNHRTTL